MPKVVVVGLGYLGLSNAVLLSTKNEVIGVDLSEARVADVNNRICPIEDKMLKEYMQNKGLNLRATSDLVSSIYKADFVIISTPTNYDEKTNCFDTTSIESVISQIVSKEPKATIIIKSTIPIGFIDNMRSRFKIDTIMFSPEFLREGRALYDNLYPSRIIVGDNSNKASFFAQLLKKCSLSAKVEILLTGTREAEAIKLFANTYLAMRVSFFNELDSYALFNKMEAKDIIKGISLDPRIGQHYNNPSFGYGGYCLPKDTRQLLANYQSVPQKLISAIVSSNQTRKNFLADIIINKNAEVVGIYRLSMKMDSDNFRQSAIQGIINQLKKHDVNVIIYEPLLESKIFANCHVETDFQKFSVESDLIITNRFCEELSNVEEKVFTRDIFGLD